MIVWLDFDMFFFDVFCVFVDLVGLLVVGVDLLLQWLLEVYCYGIFFWFFEGQFIFWWSIDLCMVLCIDYFVVFDSFKKILCCIECSCYGDGFW